MNRFGAGAAVLRGCRLAMLSIAIAGVCGTSTAQASAEKAANARKDSQALKSSDASAHFYATHDIRGKTASQVVSGMRREGFRCAVEMRALDPVEAASPPKAVRRRPVVYCSKWDPSPTEACIEQRITYDVEWDDRDVDADNLLEKLAASPVTGQSYVCVPAVRPARSNADGRGEARVDGKSK